MSILNFLDEKINGYYQNRKDYPSVIYMSKDANDKVFAELAAGTELTLSWYDKKDNYRGIPIKIKEETFIELE